MRQLQLVSERAIESRKYLALLTGIVAIGLVLRLWGIGFGLPYEYHVDEVQYVRQGVSIGERGPEPVSWGNPPLFKYLLFVEYGVLFLVGRALGMYQSAADFAQLNSTDPTALYILGRGTSAVLGGFTVLATAAAAGASYGRRASVLAAWFMAVAFIHVRDSHFAVNDVAATLLTTLSLLCALKIHSTGRIKWYVLGGIALGLGVATKYSAALAIAPLLLAHFLSPRVSLRRLEGRRVLLIPVAAAATAILASPYFVLRADRVLNDIYAGLYLPGQSGFDGWEIDPAGGYVFYLKSLAWGLGSVLFAAGVLGILTAVVRRTPSDFILLSFIAVVYLSASNQQMYFARFILPVVPPVLVLAANGLESLAARLSSRRHLIAPALAVAGLVLGLEVLAKSVRYDYLLTQPDTRTVAKAWIEAHVPNGARIAVDWPVYGPPLGSARVTSTGGERLFNVTVIGGHGLSDRTVGWFRDQGYDYLITSSFISDIPLLDKDEDLQRKRFYDSLPSEMVQVQEIAAQRGSSYPSFIFDELYGPAVSLWQRSQPGPTLRVYAVNSWTEQ